MAVLFQGEGVEPVILDASRSIHTTRPCSPLLERRVIRRRYKLLFIIEIRRSGRYFCKRSMATNITGNHLIVSPYNDGISSFRKTGIQFYYHNIFEFTC